MMTLALTNTELLFVSIAFGIVMLIIVGLFWYRVKAVYNYFFEWKQLEKKVNEMEDQQAILEEKLSLQENKYKESIVEKLNLENKLGELEARLKNLEEKNSVSHKTQDDFKDDIIVEYYMGNQSS